jgi:hypothetical protein
MGRYRAAEWASLADWRQVVDTSDFRWVQHATYGWLPEMTFNVRSVQDLQVSVGKLTKPRLVALMADVVPTPIERE